MPYDELLAWVDYFNQRPVGWREDDRTYKLLQAQGVKEKPHSIFASLAAMKKLADEKVKDGMISTKNLQASVLFNKIAGAKDGEKIKFD